MLHDSNCIPSFFRKYSDTCNFFRCNAAPVEAKTQISLQTDANNFGVWELIASKADIRNPLRYLLMNAVFCRIAMVYLSIMEKPSGINIKLDLLSLFWYSEYSVSVRVLCFSSGARVTHDVCRPPAVSSVLYAGISPAFHLS